MENITASKHTSMMMESISKQTDEENKVYHYIFFIQYKIVFDTRFS